MFMNVTNANELAKSPTHMGRPENKKDSEESHSYRNEEKQLKTQKSKKLNITLKHPNGLLQTV